MYIEVEPVTPATVAVRRKALDMNQQEFADALGVSLSTVRNWEGGRATVAPGKGAAMVQLVSFFSKREERSLKRLKDGSYKVTKETLPIAVQVAKREPDARFTGDLYKTRGPRK